MERQETIMLYKKNQSAKLDEKLFKNPTSEYRGAPFWAWNSKLDKEELKWQLEVFKKMGFGGAHLHPRTGMATPYLSDEHMDIVKTVVEKAKQEELHAYLYDEDRWPSGPAGGIVTKEEQFRGRYLLFTPHPYGSEEAVMIRHNIAQARAGRTENGFLLACYDVELNEKGYLVSARVMDKEEEAQYEKWYAYVETLCEMTWWNGQTYIDTLNKEAMDRFIEVTYEAYNKTVSEEFGETVPSIFTDEPQFPWKGYLKYATGKTDVTMPWTIDLPQTYREAYNGEDLVAGIPELIWDRADGQASLIRYHFNDHVCQRFTDAFADNCGIWCEEHGIALTGHMMKEPTLFSQTLALGEAMRAYRKFGIPGIDMLCARFEYTTAKQAQSAVHQFGKEGMLSELYGVTNWNFDFRGHKLHGDWQAALGVTLRVPHLSYVSMEGEAKRDYPASIHYQSPWWEKYALVEDHFARVSTAMTRGKAIVKVGVIHPIESYWLHWGPEETTAIVRENLDDNFKNITKWLLFGGVDFDFISESLLPELCEKAKAPLKVGKMEYDMILVPGCETLRSTTLERLEAFEKAGGHLVFVGDVATLENAIPSQRAIQLSESADRIPFQKGAILNAVEKVREIEIRNETGALTNNLLYQLREDGEGRWLFVAHGKEPYNKHISQYQDLKIHIKGSWKATLYNTMTGESEEMTQQAYGSYTEVVKRLYDYDSLLIWLEPVDEIPTVACKTEHICEEAEVILPSTVPYSLSEPNVLLLDRAEYALDSKEWHKEEELLRVDISCRKMLDWPQDIANVAQPWTISEEEITHYVDLRMYVNSAIEYEGAQLAIEHLDKVSIKWNGEIVENTAVGWFTDKSIKTVALPNIQKGENLLEVRVPITQRITIEWAYLLGDFGVEVFGKNTRITEKRSRLAFGNIVTQGLPFYSGNITYHVPIKTSSGKIKVKSSYYVGAMQEVMLDDKQAIPMIYAPYTENVGHVEEGAHVLHLTLYGNRFNSFGPLHLSDTRLEYADPSVWRTKDDKWCYEYMLRPIGIMTTPQVSVVKE